MRLGKLLHYGISHSFSTTLNLSRILVSTCQDIHHNLALEDWIYEKGSFLQSNPSTNKPGSGQSLVLLWRNHPCIVIGRHQNCWVECNLHEALADGVKVARRRSGGGTVYHDLGNLNVTVFTSRQDYDRKRNLGVVSNAMRESFGVNVSVAQRDDLILNDRLKISGTAAKLGGKVAYHHFTLLIEANLDSVKKYLHQNDHGIESKATASVRADVENLVNVNRSITYGSLIEALSKAFTVAGSYSTPEPWTYIDPTNESTFPGIRDLASKLKTWDWIYGHTPKFTVQRAFDCCFRDEAIRVEIRLRVDHGLIKDSEITVISPERKLSEEIARLCDHVGSSMNGLRFWPDDVDKLGDDLRELQTKDEFELTKCILKCIHSSVLGN